jgi:hypothetical protein
LQRGAAAGVNNAGNGGHLRIGHSPDVFHREVEQSTLLLQFGEQAQSATVSDYDRIQDAVGRMSGQRGTGRGRRCLGRG